MTDSRSTGATAYGTSTIVKGLTGRAGTELGSGAVGIDFTCDRLSREEAARL